MSFLEGIYFSQGITLLMVANLYQKGHSLLKLRVQELLWEGFCK